MELRRYWAIVWRYRLVVLALPFLVGLITSARFLAQPTGYTAETKAQVALVPQQVDASDEFFRYDTYYTYLATEYAVDDLAEVLNGNMFAMAVGTTLRGPDFNLNLADQEVFGTFEARRAHRVLEFEVTTGDPERSIAIARAAMLTLQRDPLKYFSRGDLAPRQTAAIILIETPLEARGDRVRRALNVIIQTALAGCAGLGLAFLLGYLNDRVRDPDSAAEALGLPVLGTIPRGGRGGRMA
jgi:capsular polysaccharide biosynthesis protein